MPSHRPKMRDVLTDRSRLGLSPPSAIEMRKLSRLRVNPRVKSAITSFSPALPPGISPGNVTSAGPAIQPDHAGSVDGGKLLERPLGAEQRAPVRAAGDPHVVARADVHRQVALDRIPVVVLADQLVELRVVAPAVDPRPPAHR